MANQRLSNIELLRIVCMILVVAGHANFLVHGLPTKTDMLDASSITTFRVFANQLCVIAVNCFVFISGWFSIKASTKKGLQLILQTLEYGLGISLTFILLGYTVPKMQLIRLFFIGEYYGFIIAYLQLFILAPILNLFVEQVSKKTFKTVFVSFLIFEFVYGWLGGVGNYADGYSGLHFIGLYLLAQYIRRYIIIKRITLSIACVLYLVPTVIAVVLVTVFFAGGFCSEKWAYTMMRLMVAYNSPLVLLSSIGLFFIFYNIHFTSKWINWMSTSVLAIYLIHLHPCIFDYFFKPLMLKCGLNLLMILVIIMSICLFCILIDKVRIFIEKCIIKIFSFLINNKLKFRK